MPITFCYTIPYPTIKGYSFSDSTLIYFSKCILRFCSVLGLYLKYMKMNRTFVYWEHAIY